jgi:NAD(P)H-hydrate epimerase
MHKGDCGRILIIAGSAGMTGAGVLASKSALRAGAGVVLWAIPKSLNLVAESLTTEVMSLPLPETPSGSPSMSAREILVEAAREADCVVMGPGLPVAGDTGELMRLLIPEIYAPLVLDGGAFSAIGDEVLIFRKRQGPTIITPHPGEMGHLTHKPSAEVQKNRRELAVKYASLSGTVVALKGAETIVTDGKEVYLNHSGNPGMATAGSGDVLVGVIAALVGQGLKTLEATKLGVYLHGRAGDHAAAELGQHSMIASDIIAHLPSSFVEYSQERSNSD